MMEYIAKKLPEGMGCMPLEGVFTPDSIAGAYAALNEATVAEYVWPDEGYRPEVHARVGWNEKGVHVLMYALEPMIRAECREIGGMVCVDSCMEFFLMPFPEADKRYFNAEMNPLGTLHLGLGEGRHGRVRLCDELPEGFEICTSVHDGAWWAISYTIPMSHIEAVFGRKLASGQKMLGNFYCCDETIHPHFGTWAPVVAPKPDFHRPECFQPIILK